MLRFRPRAAKLLLVARSFTAVAETPRSEIERLYQLQRSHEHTVANSTVEDRRSKLQHLHDMVLSKRQDIQEAIHADKGNHPWEVDLTEIFAVTSECKHAISHLKKWMAPQRVKTPWAMLGTTSWIHPEPKGVTLIMSPWNFPLNLSLGPLISAVAAGNTTILKPSEMSANTATVIREIVNEVFAEEEVAVVEGGIETSTHLLAQPFNHIFFTGAPALGKIVMQAASHHLASVTLELGGKSPVIVDETADIDTAAKRVAWAKTVNAGQICIAPDYIYVQETVQQQFLEHYTKWLKEFFGDNSQEASPSYAQIINERHHKRLESVYQNAIDTGATLEHGGAMDSASKHLEPTVLTNVSMESQIMKDEIFGPLMPVVTFKSLEEPIAFINANEKPLAMYIFSKNDKNTQHIIDSTRAGATVINHCILHFLNGNLPFGGVNNSGMGKAHGVHGFREFSNERAVMKQWAPISGMDLMMPPYNTSLKKTLIDWTIKLF